MSRTPTTTENMTLDSKENVEKTIDPKQESSVSSVQEEPISSMNHCVSVTFKWDCADDSDETPMDELTSAVEEYCQDQKFETQFDEMENNVGTYDFIGPQNRVEGFVVGLKVILENYIKEDSWESVSFEFENDMEEGTEETGTSLDQDIGKIYIHSV